MWHLREGVEAIDKSIPKTLEAHVGHDNGINQRHAAVGQCYIGTALDAVPSIRVLVNKLRAVVRLLEEQRGGGRGEHESGGTLSGAAQHAGTGAGNKKGPHGALDGHVFDRCSINIVSCRGVNCDGNLSNCAGTIRQ